MKSDLREAGLLFWLGSIRGLGPHSIWQLVQDFGSVSGIVTASKNCQTNISPNIAKLIAKAAAPTYIEPPISEPYICILDSAYPELLKTIYDPPLFLYYRGNIALLKNRHLLTIVGSRHSSNYHAQQLASLVADLSHLPLAIVSGLALGIDALSHRQALDNKLATVAVLGSGLSDKCIYPRSNIALAREIVASDGLLLSEYSEDTAAIWHYFPKRNRILAGLSATSIIVSGAKKSGTLITAQVAIDAGREVYAMPGNINMLLSQGPNSLIKNGAHLLDSAQDIIESYNLQPKKKSLPKINFTNNLHAKIFTLLQTESLTTESLSLKLAIPHTKVVVAVSEMELSGVVKINQTKQITI